MKIAIHISGIDVEMDGTAEELAAVFGGGRAIDAYEIATGAPPLEECVVSSDDIGNSVKGAIRNGLSNEEILARWPVSIHSLRAYRAAVTREDKAHHEKTSEANDQ